MVDCTDESGVLNGSGVGVTVNSSGCSVTVVGSNDTISEGANDFTGVFGNNDVLNASGGSASFTGTGDTGDLSGATIYEGANTALTVVGASDTVYAGSGDQTGFAGTGSVLVGSSTTVYADTSGTNFTVEGNGDTVNSGFADNIVGLTGSNDIAQLSNGEIITNATSAASLTIRGSGDIQATISGPTQGAPATAIDAIYNAVLDREVDPSGLTAAQIMLASGGSLAGVMAAVANSAQAPSRHGQHLRRGGPHRAVPGTDERATAVHVEVPSDDGTPSQAEFNAFATRCPLETQANGVNLGLQLADEFAFTAPGKSSLARRTIHQ